MKKKVRDLITYGGLALAGYALFSKVAQPAAAAPATAGMGALSTNPHPAQVQPSHPFWRWFRGTTDYNSMQNYASPSESTFGGGPGQWAYSNYDLYGPYGMYGGGSSETTFGGGPYFDYEPVTYEASDSLESRASQNY